MGFVSTKMKRSNYSWSLSFVLVDMLVLFPCAFGYHTFGNVMYHCWWSNATVSNSDPIECEGISIEWMLAPPLIVGQGEKFNVSYKLNIEEDFYSNMFGFSFEKYHQNNISTPDDLKFFCNNSECPENLVANPFKFPLVCCVWHANVHICHPNPACSTAQLEFCGPWVPDDLQQSTHTQARYGNIFDVFTAEMDIQVSGTNYVIAHIQIGDVQLAVQTTVSVEFCGDEKCSNDETCSTCKADCCPDSFPLYIVYTIAGVCLFLVPFPVIFVVWVCYRRRKLFYDESWIIDTSEIRQLIDQGTYSPNLKDGINSLASIHTVLLNGAKSGDSESCNGGSRLQSACTYSRVSLGSQGQSKYFFTQTGTYEGRTVALKKLPRKQIILTNRIRFEVMKVRALDHPNLCRFIGAAVINPCIVSEYCPKGSLSDVLQNQDIPLNWGFRLSFATDIARGMSYLHSKKIYHERLTSNNCVIDDRWTLKITDYGLSSFRKSGTLSAQRSAATVLESAMYRAPELRAPNGIILPTAAADVYSFSIILYEISTRINPTTDDLFVDTEGRPKPPVLTNEDCPCPSEYLELMKQCWDLSPSNRPNFDYVKKSLHKMNPNKESPVDMMMIMMEKYSNHLEQLVNERTQELITEQKKTSNLLYSMLPRQVADELRHGRPAAAQSFKSSTIFFSDIVGFTSLAGSSTPMEIVNMLNELYSLFDDVLDRFDVYKVETIGDAYMVVSGVPQENGNKHAGEIAKMALKLIGVTEAFKIPHRPKDKLNIRVGIHSGSVCAGVVGLKMPRYCLFGDTVNTASRMESTSEAMKIQCSDETYKLLKLTDSFTLECRGAIEIKGKGPMTTWWLTGLKQTMEKPWNLTPMHHPVKLSPINQPRQRSPSSLSSSDILGGGGAASPNLSLGLKHPFSCSPLPTAVVSPSRARKTELLPISVTDFSSGQTSIKTTSLNLETLSESDTTSLML